MGVMTDSMMQETWKSRRRRMGKRDTQCDQALQEIITGDRTIKGMWVSFKGALAAIRCERKLPYLDCR